MASEYGYITVANLESFMAVTFDSIDAAYTDTVVEMNISIAERIVNGYVREPPSSATDSMVAATTIIAADLMQNLMFHQGYATDKDAYKERRDAIIKDLVSVDDAVGVDSIPMSGADRYYHGYNYPGY